MTDLSRAARSKSQKPYYSTFRLKDQLNQAMLQLYLQQAPQLLSEIQKQFTEPEIRTGLSIKILYNTPPDTTFPLETIQPILTDLETMIKDHDHLRSTGEPHLRLRCLRQELRTVQRYVNLDEIVSLNCTPSEMTFQDSQLNQPPTEFTPSIAPAAEEGDKEPSTTETDGCNIM